VSVRVAPLLLRSLSGAHLFATPLRIFDLCILAWFCLFISTKKKDRNTIDTRKGTSLGALKWIISVIDYCTNKELILACRTVSFFSNIICKHDALFHQLIHVYRYHQNFHDWTLQKNS
jgi:hypothetical protein